VRGTRLETMLLGAHVPSADPLAEAAARTAELVQIFLSPPQSWKAPKPRDDAEQLRAASLPIYVHAPYIMNVATTDNRVRHPSRQTLQRTVQAAEAIGAAGVIVHGGHLPVGDDPEQGFRNWRTTLERLETEVPILIENTAGGDNAVARHLDRLARLWEAIDGVEVPYGLCLDTCHLHAAGEDLHGVAERVKAITGRIDLVHLNDSRDAFGSGRDRHANLGTGQIESDLMVAVVADAQAPTIVETPGEAGAHAADLAWIRKRLGLPAA
jgi:deoxyribonuclease IV